MPLKRNLVVVNQVSNCELYMAPYNNSTQLAASRLGRAKQRRAPGAGRYVL